MGEYPEVVSKIVADYVERLSLHLSTIPARERDDFLREIQSHIYEAYQHESGDDELARILSVLRKLGEPAEVVSDRLPEAIVRAGGRRRSPLHIIGGIMIAVFGVPLGFAGVAVLIGVFAALAGIVIAYYATASSFLLAGGVLSFMAMIRIYQPELWDLLVSRSVIQMQDAPGEFFDVLSPGSQGAALIVLACVFVVFGVAMLWLGRFLVRGIRFLLSLAFDQIRQLAGKTRQVIRRPEAPVAEPRNISLRSV
jgi:uncharacterized membrane protein